MNVYELQVVGGRAEEDKRRGEQNECGSIPYSNGHQTITLTCYCTK